MDDVESDEDLCRVVEKHPVPFMMLVTGSTLPPIVAEGDQEMKYAFSEFYIPTLPEFFPEDVFEVEEYMGLVKLRLAGVDHVPHFATAYYDREEELLQLTSLTLHGYELLVRAFKKLSHDFDEWPDLTVSFSMKTVTEKILKREVDIFPYESLFDEEMDDEFDEDDDFMDRMNWAMGEMLPYINRGELPDVSALAEKYDVDEDTLRRLADHTIERLRNIK